MMPAEIFSKRAAEPMLLPLYRTMLAARRIDQLEAEMVSTGEAFFHVSGAGHEGAAVLNLFLGPQDWLHCHYRDKALMLGRGVPPESFFHSLLCTARSHSAGRQMSAHMSDPGRRILSVVGPVGNQALQAVGVASEIKADASRPLVVCSLGDGSSQQGEVLEAIAEAVRSRLPVLFWIEDNGLSISTPTAGKTFYDLPDERPAAFYGMPIHRIDGRDAAGAQKPVRSVVERVRQDRGPAIVVFNVDRLSNHTNADDQRVYRAEDAIEHARRCGDPVERLVHELQRGGVSRKTLERIRRDVDEEVHAAAEAARRTGEPGPCLSAKPPLPNSLASPDREYRGSADRPRLTMREAIRAVLGARLGADQRITLFGEDIEDPKGDVFGVTRGLSARFPGRVLNAPLSESTIVGTSIGRALAGGRPVAFLQFADFLPLAFNQIASELGSMHWRTNGGWSCPVIVMIACGGYRPGLGPFHGQTMESIAAHVPGVDVLMPSTAADAAGLLNAAFEAERPALFFYPKISLNDRNATTSVDVERQFVPLGRARRIERGNDLTVVTWGSTVAPCRKAVEALKRVAVSVDLIDLRSLSPWDRQTVVDSARRSRRLLVVHEDNHTCGFAGEVVATATEAISDGVIARRVTRPDTYVPCNFANQLATLPRFPQILSAAAELLDLELEWESPVYQEAGDSVLVEAHGSSPADEMVSVLEWVVKVGDRVERGQRLAEAEADKAVFQLTAPRDGIVERLLVQEGEQVRVGTPILRLLSSTGGLPGRQQPPDPGTAFLHRRKRNRPNIPSTPSVPADSRLVSLSSIATVEGAGTVTNEDLVRRFPNKSAEEIFALTGIRCRRRASGAQTARSMAADAVRKALGQEGLSVNAIGLVICSTTTPTGVTPSMACRILHELAGDRTVPEIPAYDINAACSGYLYALGCAHDWLQARPNDVALVVTTEVLSQVVDPADFETAVLFGDAASATVVYGDASRNRGRWKLERPLLATRAESGGALSVPAIGTGFIQMRGRTVFALAVRKMSEMLEQACRDGGIEVEDLGFVAPHQANGRILQALAARFPSVSTLNQISHRGNTSSSSIPQCLANLQATTDVGNIGLCSFGGGFTFGAALLKALPAVRQDNENDDGSPA